MAIIILCVTVVIILGVLALGNTKMSETANTQNNVVKTIIPDETTQKISEGSEEECIKALKQTHDRVIDNRTCSIPKCVERDLINALDKRVKIQFTGLCSARYVYRECFEKAKASLAKLEENMDNLLEDRSTNKYLKGSNDGRTIINKIYRDFDICCENPQVFFRNVKYDMFTAFEMYDYVVFGRVKNPALLEKSNAVISEAATDMINFEVAYKNKKAAEESYEKAVEIRAAYEDLISFMKG
ncbi:MAG: hypothetical protein J5881_00270 [Clostridia bacterium]|nr:hypothetical protein [Clostridia bacterium]